MSLYDGWVAHTNLAVASGVSVYVPTGVASGSAVSYLTDNLLQKYCHLASTSWAIYVVLAEASAVGIIGLLHCYDLGGETINVAAYAANPLVGLSNPSRLVAEAGSSSADWTGSFTFPSTHYNGRAIAVPTQTYRCWKIWGSTSTAPKIGQVWVGNYTRFYWNFGPEVAYGQMYGGLAQATLFGKSFIRNQYPARLRLTMKWQGIDDNTEDQLKALRSAVRGGLRPFILCPSLDDDLIYAGRAPDQSTWQGRYDNHGDDQLDFLEEAYPRA